jgi:hypothetical protein
MSDEIDSLEKAFKAVDLAGAPLMKSMAELHNPLFEGLKALNIGLMPNLQLSQLEIPKLSVDFQMPAFSNVLKDIQKTWQMPLALNAFSESLGFNRDIWRLPSLDIPKIDWGALQDRDRRATRVAAQNNWFIQPETPMSFTSRADECRGAVSQLDELFTGMIQAVIPEILSRLTNSYPKHAPLIAEAFRLHGEKRYLAAIPLAIISAEGIAYGVSKKSIFNITKNKPDIAGWISKRDVSNMAHVFLATLAEQFPMSRSRPGKLNRHLVLHGRDTDYGTEQYSYQAISLLGFVGWAFATDGLVREPA